MNIELIKFGTTLTSRQFGKEAYLAFSPILNEIKNEENVIVNFTGVNTFAPSWADEFLTPLLFKYQDRLILTNTSNSSVKATIEILEQTNEVKFKVES